MKRKLTKKLLCLALSGILMTASVEMPSAHAQEETEIIQESAEETAETETAEPVSLAETEEAQQTEIKTEETKQRTESETTETQPQTQETLESSEENAASTETLVEENEPEEESSTEDVTEYSILVVNPLYEEVVDSSELLQSPAAAAVNATETFATVEKAAEYMRGQMVAREQTITFNVPAGIVTGNGFFGSVYEAALAETDSGQEGDALKWGCKGYSAKSASDGSNCQVTFTITYHSTYAQEQELTTKVNSVLEGLKLDGKPDYEKVKLIHDYICDNVDYDYTLQKYSAYDAMCTGTSVCQGYAVLFYRMCKDAGLSVRLVSGKGNGGAHGWNIVKIGSNARAAGQYYNVDCTWDGQSAVTHWTYFLKSEEDFFNHERDPKFTTKEFLDAYPMSAESYFDDSVKLGLNADNIAPVTLWTLEETTVSTDASRKPKVLIFYSTTCYRSQNTLRSAAAYAFNYDEVDIYAVAGNGSDDDIKSFKAAYDNSNNIIYTSSNSRAMNAYTGILDDMNYSYTFNTPVVCYIDVNNKFQHATFGATTGSEIAANLKQYCSGVIIPANYRITYVLDGGENDTRNPSVYISGSEALDLYDAVKEGCTFAGWYTDSRFIRQVTQIEQGLTGNLTLYAKWADDPDYEYTITYELDGGTNAPENPSVYTQSTDTITLSDPEKEGYTFAGWYSDAAFTEKVTQIAKGSTGSITLYAKWEDNAKQDPVVNPDPSWFPKIDMTLAQGNIIIGVSGDYYTETAETILGELNRIRMEACDEGVINEFTNQPLTPEDYVPLEWSSDLEAIARLRAAEASLMIDHDRPNGEDCFTAVTTNKVGSFGENLAWNYKGLMEGIKQWYDEKGAWVNKTGGQTGHYTNMINPSYRYVAVSAFHLSEGAKYPYTVSQEFSVSSSTLDSRKNDADGRRVQEIEIAGSSVTELTFDTTSPIQLKEGNVHSLVLNAAVTCTSNLGTVSYTGPVHQGGDWKSSDEAVAAVDEKGNITAIKEGTATISVTVKKASAEITVTVDNQGGSSEDPADPENPTDPTDPENPENPTDPADPENPENPTDPVDPENPVDPEPEYPDKPSTDVNLKDAAISVWAPNVISNGKAGIRQDSTPVLTWKHEENGKTIETKLVKDYHYTVEDKAGFDYKTAGVQTYVIKGVSGSGFTGEVDASYTIYEKNAANVKDAAKLAVKLETTTFDYKGSAVTPTDITVSDGKTVLAKGTDYDIVYKNNYNAGKASIIIVGRGTANAATGISYVGSKEVSFTIKKVNIKNLASNVTYNKAAYPYTGKAVTVSGLALKLNDTYTLKEGTDYTVSYSANTKPGTAGFTIKAMGNNFSGAIPNQKFTIGEFKLTDIPADALKTIEYSPKGAKLSTISFNGITLKEGTDYTVKYYGKAKSVGEKVKVDIIGKNVDRNKKLTDIELTVVPADFGKVNVASEPDLMIDAKKWSRRDSQIKVTDQAGAKLKLNTDYKLDWDASDKGSAKTGLTLTIRPSGSNSNYTGIKTVTYRVADKLVPKNYKVADKHFDGKNPVTIQAKDITGLEAGDYKIVSYKNNIKKGKASVTIEGAGRYYGRITLKFNIFD